MRDISPAGLKRFRKALGVTQSQFARDAGVSKRTVIRWEHGDTPIPRAIKLAVLEARDQAQLFLASGVRSELKHPRDRSATPVE
jgi:transcriptional regulator with XRE-family HTH domain